jgi:hypothetical protein
MHTRSLLLLYNRSGAVECDIDCSALQGIAVMRTRLRAMFTAGGIFDVEPAKSSRCDERTTFVLLGVWATSAAGVMRLSAHAFQGIVAHRIMLCATALSGPRSRNRTFVQRRHAVRPRSSVPLPGVAQPYTNILPVPYFTATNPTPFLAS